jgi:hypothetical protein
MKKDDLIRYRAFANALIRLNNATTTLLNEGADPDAIKLILKGTATLYAELEANMLSHTSEATDSTEQDQDGDVPLRFDSDSSFSLTSDDLESKATRPAKRPKTASSEKEIKPPKRCTKSGASPQV